MSERQVQAGPYSPERVYAQLKAACAGLPTLYATEDTPTAEKVLSVKFFSPQGSWSWYPIEAREETLDDGRADTLCFGLVDGFEQELGYFSLRELAACHLGDDPGRGSADRHGRPSRPRRLPVEIDAHFPPTAAKEILR